MFQVVTEPPRVSTPSAGMPQNPPEAPRAPHAPHAPHARHDAHGEAPDAAADALAHERAQRYPMIEAIRRGETAPAVIHEALGREDSVLDVRAFNLFYGQKQALFDISMTMPRGKVTSIIGPSGCGKSTLLRAVNRLNDLIDGVRVEGEMVLNGRPVYARDVDVIDLRKRIGMVFQRPNPFPMSIYENVVYPLRIDGENRRAVLDEACERSLQSAAIWDEVKDRLKESALSMSGGQQQRLCIARAIVADPEVLLLDEPCSALDPIATLRIEELIQQIAQRYTVLIVTHNMQQATRVSDFTAFMYLGRLVEYGATVDVFQNPRLAETEEYVTGRFG